MVQRAIGNSKPCPDVLYITTNRTYEPNTRDETKVEMRNQMFALYDIENKIFYISNQRKRTTYISFLKELLKLDIIIKPLYRDSEQFKQTISQLDKIKFT